jgi:hypothetical protein
MSPAAQHGNKSPSEVWFPSAFSQQPGAFFPWGFPHPPGVASSGFRTLSTLCSPDSLPSLFHPGPALGIWPFKAFLLRPRRTVFRPSLTLVAFLTMAFVIVPYPQGFVRGPSHAHPTRLFTCGAAPSFLGFLSSEASYSATFVLRAEDCV